MIRVGVAGVAGRMGSRIARLVLQSDDMVLSGGWERSDHPSVGTDVGSILGGELLGLVLAPTARDVLQDCDVAIDFTSASASMEHLTQAVEERTAMVIGSTGFTKEQRERIRALTAKVPCVVAPNMSVGVNVLFKIVSETAKLLGTSYDVEIVEAHHRSKKDAPSGTAVRLGQRVAEVRGTTLDEVGVFERYGMTGERRDSTIGIQTVRAGDIVGEHTVIFAGTGERIEIIHRAHSRDNFAKGALEAARWIVDKPAGLYDMQDVLGLV